MADYIFDLGIPKPVRIQFADGLREVPALYVASFGGEKKLKACAEELAKCTFAQFMGATDAIRTRDYLNNFQRAFIGPFRK